MNSSSTLHTLSEDQVLLNAINNSPLHIALKKIEAYSRKSRVSDSLLLKIIDIMEQETLINGTPDILEHCWCLLAKKAKSSPQTYPKSAEKFSYINVSDDKADQNQSLLNLQLFYEDNDPSENALSLWERVFDDGFINEGDFFAHEDNRKLFEKLAEKPLADEITNLQKLGEHPKRYRNLCVALSTYRTTNANITDPGTPGNAKITYAQKSDWAQSLFLYLLHHLVSTTEGERTTLHFSRYMYLLSTDIDKVGNAKSISEYIAANPEHNLTHFTAIACGLYNNFTQFKAVLSDEQIQRLTDFDVQNLPSAFKLLLDNVQNNIDFAIPSFLPPEKEAQLVDIRRSNGSQQNKLMPLYFTTQIYIAYCDAKLKTDLDEAEQSKYQKYLDYWTAPIILRNEFKKEQKEEYPGNPSIYVQSKPGFMDQLKTLLNNKAVIALSIVTGGVFLLGFTLGFAMYYGYKSCTTKEPVPPMIPIPSSTRGLVESGIAATGAGSHAPAPSSLVANEPEKKQIIGPDNHHSVPALTRKPRC